MFFPEVDYDFNNFWVFFILAVLSLHSCLAYKKNTPQKNLPYTYACTLKNVGKEKDHFLKK